MSLIQGEQKHIWPAEACLGLEKVHMRNGEKPVQMWKAGDRVGGLKEGVPCVIGRT